MSKLKFIASLIVAMGLAWTAAAVDSTWRGGDGNLSDPSKWYNDTVPPKTGGSGHIMKFPAGTHRITVDQDAEVQEVIINGDANVTFVGTGKITMLGGGSGCLTIAANQRVTVDGADLKLQTYSYVHGTLEVKSGGFKTLGTLWARKDGTKFIVSGGRFESADFRLDGGDAASFFLSGGVAKFDSCTRGAGNTWSITGGLFQNLDTRITVPVGTVDYGLSTNVIKEIWFAQASTKDAPSRFYGDYLALLSDYGFRAYEGYVFIPHGITLGCDGNWISPARGTYDIRERLHFDTADYLDPSVKRTIKLNNFGMAARVDFAAFGGGTLNMSMEKQAFGFDKVLAGFALGANTTMLLGPYLYDGKEYPIKNEIRTQKISLAAGSDLTMMAGYTTLAAGDSTTVSPGATVRVIAPKALTTTTRYSLIDFGPAGDATGIAPVLEGGNLDGWSVNTIANMVLLAHESLVLKPSTTSEAEWFGGHGPDLSTDANWSSGTCQSGLTGGQKTLSFKTTAGDVNNDIDNLKLAQIKIATSAGGPVRLGGKPVTLCKAAESGSSAAIFLGDAIVPLVFTTDVVAGQASGSAFGISARQSYVAFLGKLTAPNNSLAISGGEVMIGGTATAKNLKMNADWWSGSDRHSALHVLKGGSFAVSDQSTPFANANCSSFFVHEDGLLSFAGGAFNNEVAVTHSVLGRLSIGVPLSSTASLSFLGSGRVDVASTKSTATAASVTIGEKLRLCPASWSTVTADGEGPLTIAVATRATLGATADWTYGVADGVTTATAAADRALTVTDHETLTVDTANPDTGAAQAITLADPIHAAGAKIVKTGVGTLTLASAANDLATTDVRVEGGALAWTAAQTVGSLMVLPAGTLLAGAADEAVATLTVNDDLALDGVTVGLADAAKGLAKEWTELVKVPSGKTISGTPVAMDGQRLSIVTNADGSQSLCGKAKSGLVLIFR